MEKIIHRIYFDFDNQGDPFKVYLDSWRRELPEYEIKLWNKHNLPLDLNDFVKYLHKKKMFSYLSDYFRIWLLVNYGGIYFDADIEVLNGNIFDSIYTNLLNSNDYDMIIGIESERNGKLTAHSMATKKNADHPLLRFMLDMYENYFKGPLLHIVKYFDLPSLMGLYFIDRFKDNPYLKDGYFKGLYKILIIDRLCIYPQDYFSPVTRYNDELSITAFSKNTCLCHHFSASWKNKNNELNTFKDNLINNKYLINRNCLNELKELYPDIKIVNNNIEWRIPEKMIHKLNKYFNYILPYGSLRYNIVKKFMKLENDKNIIIEN